MMAEILGRRGFLNLCGAGMGAVAAMRGRAPRISSRAQVVLTRSGPAVATIHNDQPWHDFTGRAEPYRPPAGLRSGDSAAVFDEETLRRLHYVI